MKLFRTLFTASFLAIASLSVGCGGDTDETTPTEGGKALSEVEITTGIDTLAKGSTAKFTAKAKFADGTERDVSTDEDTVWNTSNPEVATVDEEGTVTAVDEGMVDITATYLGKTGEETFLVTP